MSKNSHRVWIVASIATFLVNSIGCSGEFDVFLKCFQDLKNLISKILKEKLTIACLVVPFFF